MGDLSGILAEYPLVIEPTTTTLEAKSGKALLCRISSESVYSLASGVPADIVHFFGESIEAYENNAILCYDVGGRLLYIMYCDNGEWSIATVPGDIIDKLAKLPSVRLVFVDDRAKASFLYYVERVLSGKIQNPSLAVIFDRLAAPVRVLDVWMSGETEGGGDAR